MIRIVLFALISIFLITVLRMIAGALTRGVSEMMSGESHAPGSSVPPPSSKDGRAGVELRRDPVCGTFVPATSIHRKSVRDREVVFCSPECRDRYSG